jgi:cell division septum initiation protein DivIVA
MEITPRELRDIEIRESFKGYNRDDVNDLLERAAETLEAANERVRQLTEQLEAARSEPARNRETEDILHRTLLLAQRAADEAVAEAQAKSRQMLDDAEIQSRRMLADAEADARRRGEAERRRLEEEILDLAARRDTLLADVEAMTRFEAEYRERMMRALEADLAALRTRPAAQPGPRPEPSEVDIPVLPEGMAHREDVERAQARTDATAAHADTATGEVEMGALFRDDERSAAATEAPSGSQAAAAGAATEAAGPQIDLLGEEEALDAEVLDDDAFFATLREAVHDDAPLGPREDGGDDIPFFDQDDSADRGSLRDVFRRRR